MSLARYSLQVAARSSTSRSKLLSLHCSPEKGASLPSLSSSYSSISSTAPCLISTARQICPRSSKAYQWKSSKESVIADALAEDIEQPGRHSLFYAFASSSLLASCLLLALALFPRLSGISDLQIDSIDTGCAASQQCCIQQTRRLLKSSRKI